CPDHALRPGIRPRDPPPGPRRARSAGRRDSAAHPAAARRGAAPARGTPDGPVIASLDSSVLLRILLRQPKGLREWRRITRGVSSAVAEVECMRTLDRL